MSSVSDRLPPRLMFAVGALAGAMLLLEVMVTRLFSVLFFHHFSFFAISLIMIGLALGGILVARWDTRAAAEGVFFDRLALLALGFGVFTLLATVRTATRPPTIEELSLSEVALHAMGFLPGLVAAGAFLAAAFARRKSWIGQLYAADLATAAVSCLAAIVVMRVVQGPAMLLAPVGLAAVAALVVGRSHAIRWLALAALLVSLGGIAASLASHGAFLRLGGGAPFYERWNEHSRVVVRPRRAKRAERLVVIDRSAATIMRRISPDQARGAVKVYPPWQRSANYIVYQLGRPLDRVAIIGVGGGEDIRPPLAQGARQIDGYELNQILIDLLERDFRDFNDLASRPELRLIHGEARVGIRTSDRTYDVIQASFIDTWAATASGGFVLSENGLYTVEGWRTFLNALSERGILTMSRWLIAQAPAETQRLVALAAKALESAGIPEPAKHVLLVGQELPPRSRGPWSLEGTAMHATILVSKSAFSRKEVNRFLKICRDMGFRPLAAPRLQSPDPVIDRLLQPEQRARAIEESPFDISPPTDERPYFFLQIRPRDVLTLRGRDFGPITEITFNGVRVLMILTVVAFTFTLMILTLTAFTLPSARASRQERTRYRWMALYFFSIGLGYILIQLALHQRLILVLGHPTLVLSVVLFWMLLGTGAGSAVSGRLFPDGTLHRAWWAIVMGVAILWLLFPGIEILERVSSPFARAALTGCLLGSCGFVLGFGFPLGVRVVAPTGEWAVQKMWAVNGAASIAASAMAALIGVGFGSRAVILAGLAAYLAMVAFGSAALRTGLSYERG